MKPILKWAGGKSRLAAHISTVFAEPCRGTYFEPFTGSAAVYLHRRARGTLHGKAVLADVNAKLMEFHRAIRDHVDEVVLELERLPHEDWRERYYEVREAYNRGPWEGPAHAARFVWLNRACFNGLYRENRHGQFNVPCGSYAKLSLPEPWAFHEVSRLLQGAEIVHGGFDVVMERAGEGDHVYCDPPYVPLSATANFTAYCKEPFGHAEQEKLAAMAVHASHRGARVVLSNHDLPIVRDEYYPEKVGFVVHGEKVSRAISRNGASRAAVAEVIAVIGPRRQAA